MVQLPVQRLGDGDPGLTVHSRMTALGRTAATRGQACQALFRRSLDPARVQDIRKALNFAVPLGDARFRVRIERTLGRPSGHGRRGRPPRTDDGQRTLCRGAQTLPAA